MVASESAREGARLAATSLSGSTFEDETIGAGEIGRSSDVAEKGATEGEYSSDTDAEETRTGGTANAEETLRGVNTDPAAASKRCKF